MPVSVVLIVLGFILPVKDAGWMVDSASALTKKFNVFILVIGFTGRETTRKALSR